MNVEGGVSYSGGEQKSKQRTLIQEVEVRQQAKTGEQQYQEQQERKSSKIKRFARKAWNSISGKFGKRSAYGFVVSLEPNRIVEVSGDKQKRSMPTPANTSTAPASLSSNIKRADMPEKDPFADASDSEKTSGSDAID